VCGWASEARISVEATPRPQADEDLACTSLEPLLELHRIIASVEDEQRSGPLLLFLVLMREAHKCFDLLSSHLVGVLRRTQALHVHEGNPALANEIELCDELVGPTRHDRLPRWVARRMVVEAALRTTLCVAAIPHASVHGIDGRGRFTSGKRMVSEQPPQSMGVDSSMAERVVETAPPTAMRRLQAQVDWRRYCLCGEEGISEFEEGVSATMEAAIEWVSEGAEGV
jgi:hypothetical protein